MASPIQALFNGQLSTAALLLYSSGTGVWTQISKLLCVNTDTVGRTVTFYVVPSGGSAGTANITTNAQGILNGDSFNSPNEVGLVLNPGDGIYGLASAGNVVNCLIAGVQTTS